jgi:hypothetical protein
VRGGPCPELIRGVELLRRTKDRSGLLLWLPSSGVAWLDGRDLKLRLGLRACDGRRNDETRGAILHGRLPDDRILTLSNGRDILGGHMSIAPLDHNLKDWIEAFSWLAAISGGLVAVFKGSYELRQNRLQRAQELRWRQAQAGKQLNDEMLADRAAKNAMDMLDWDGNSYQTGTGQIVPVSKEDWVRALRVTHTEFNDKEKFVRDCFDNLLYFMGVLEHHISRGLVLFEDVAYPIEYYADLMARDPSVLAAYIETYGFSRSEDFLTRFPRWQQQMAVAKLKP